LRLHVQYHLSTRELQLPCRAAGRCWPAVQAQRTHVPAAVQVRRPYAAADQLAGPKHGGGLPLFSLGNENLFPCRAAGRCWPAVQAQRTHVPATRRSTAVGLNLKRCRAPGSRRKSCSAGPPPVRRGGPACRSQTWRRFAGRPCKRKGLTFQPRGDRRQWV
jgi:hypothetical protein